MKTHNTWAPSSMEQTCLRHLDSPESWTMLRVDRPENTETITWRHVRRIVGYNLVLFGMVFAILMLLVARASGYGVGDLKEDLPEVLLFVIVTSVAMSVFAASVYKRSWNRRARFLVSREE